MKMVRKSGEILKIVFAGTRALVESGDVYA